MRVVWVLSDGLTDPCHSPHQHTFLLVPEHTVSNSLDLWTQRTQVADKVKCVHIMASMKQRTRYLQVQQGPDKLCH